MLRTVGLTGLVVSCAAGLTAAADWRLEDAQLIDSNGTHPSLWASTIAYLDGDGGAVMYYDGEPIYVYGPDDESWEPQNANGSVGWRNYDAGENEIFRWEAPPPGAVTNVSNSPGAVDSDLAAGGNGDFIWSQDHTWLMYYDASSDTTTPLGVKGVYPSLYITDSGETTYAYQDPDSPYEVKYFDGTITHTVGIGYTEVLGPTTTYEAHPSVWDDAVVWLGEGVGNLFAAGEVFYWKNGQTQRLTDDDALGGVADNDPCVWHDRVIWSRRVAGPFLPLELFLWDGADITQLTTTGGRSPSLHLGQVAWVDDGGLHLAFLAGGRGDCNDDGLVDLLDYADFETCLLGPAGQLTPECECFDLDDSGHVDLGDFAVFQRVFTGP